jgi:transposase-like protein
MKYANALPSHSQSSKAVKNGHRHGKQSYLCRNCQSQFRGNPQPPGYSTQVKDLCVKMSLNGMGWSGLERVTGIWHNSVINWVRQAEAKIALENYEIPETALLDELQTFVGSKKTKSGSGES